MRNITSIIYFCFLLCCPLLVFADDCTDALVEAKELYKSGNYQKAKELFEYVKTECPQNYTEAVNWIISCETALNPQQSTKQTASQGTTTKNTYLKVNGSTSNSMVYLLNTSSSKTITISCSTSYSIYNVPSWCTVSNKTSTSFVLSYNANPNTYTRYGSIDISGGGTSIRLSLEQAAKPSTSNNATNTTNTGSSVSTSLQVSKTLVTATASGVTEYITVTCNKAWEIQYPSGGMYTATRSGNSVKVVITANTTTSDRSDFFNIRTLDGSKTVKISLSQSKRSTSSSYSSYRSRNYSLSKYQQYTNYCGDYEITWFGMRAGICTGISYGYRLFSFRLGPVQINPIEITADYNFVTDEVAAVYTPSVDFFIPFQDDAAFYFGAGPSIHISDYTYAWADVSVGVHWHWGSSASSDFFMRYNGSFMFGISIQWSTDY